MKTLLLGVAVLGLVGALPAAALAQALDNPTFAEPAFAETVFRARVEKISGAGTRPLPGTELTQTYQRITVRIIEGAREGELVVLENDSPTQFKEGNVFYLHRTPGIAGESEMWSIGEPDRRWLLFALTLIFIAVTVFAAGKAGARALVSLVVSFAIIIFGLLPALAAGWPPALTSVGFAVAMLALAMTITHGANRLTFIALLGSVAALALAAGMAEVAVSLGQLSGFVSDEVVFLNFAARGALDLTGLLLGGILIGVVGVLNDVSVSQVHTVAEIHTANPALSRPQVLAKAMRVGREHLGAVVNTLPLAYAGVSLPLLLLFSTTDAPFLFVINREIFSAEIIRTLVGGVGLMLSGVVATLVAVGLVVGKGRVIQSSRTSNHHHHGQHLE